MSAVYLKLIAVVTMFIDHLTASCFYPWGIGTIRIECLDMSLYMLGRTIGRIAFPIYCFLIAEGVRHTRNWKKYALRLLILALLSEFPFDFGLHRLRVDWSRPDLWQQFWRAIDWQHQNVFFTLLLGMLAVQFLKATQQAIVRLKKTRQKTKQEMRADLVWQEARGKQQTGRREEHTTDQRDPLVMLLWLLRYICWAALTFGLGYLAKYVLHTDYGMGGVVMISIMGLIYEYWEDCFPFMPRQVIRVVICTLGLWVCCRILNSPLEYYGMLAMLPIALYNGKKGYSSRALQYGFYLFYPVHLLAVGVLAILA